MDECLVSRGVAAVVGILVAIIGTVGFFSGSVSEFGGTLKWTGSGAFAIVSLTIAVLGVLVVLVVLGMSLVDRANEHTSDHKRMNRLQELIGKGDVGSATISPSYYAGVSVVSVLRRIEERVTALENPPKKTKKK